ncbi:2-succinyl-5-enolpyruvyl-6-hydroxy-3-cyclohexene-1-carboxylic-acid synthase [Fodinibius sp. Rm-B-1B1-1]|uniref:2-succinyl-5-enolpyruvyl-6-hydroxy-3- cyclohexene-1-carboxylic-acid synthase n=1 Tax=Fodinibius alkaliphilus TaxID=3140241 RepID=UPI00315AA099
MIESHQGNIALRWANTFFKHLSSSGVQHVVISPGSRSTPLTLAAAINPRLKKQVILDERSAAFTALGIGKATNMPAALICTSGTALANYHPAVIEARQSGVPLILATADRPPHLHATGANQAIDQLKIFGDYPVFFQNVGEPQTGDKDIKRLRMLAQQSVSISREKRGPVHLNFPFRKPLEPTTDYQQKIQQEYIKSNDDSEGHTPEVSTGITLDDSFQQQISSAQKPLIIVGPLAPGDDTTSIVELANKINAPILSEPSISSQQVIHSFAGFLRNESLRTQLAPDMILRFGFQPTDKSLELALDQWSPNHHVHFASTTSWQDATLSNSQRIAWMGKKFSTTGISSQTKSQWSNQWKDAAKQFASHYRNIISQKNTLTDGVIYHRLTPQLTDQHFVMASNSFPARDIHLFGEQASNIPLFVNRGASGIDGITSTAMGISRGLQKSGVLFTGDLAFLHDTNALLNHRNMEQSLAIVVINNNGGSIFRMLPIANNQKHFETYFETPQQANINKLAETYDIPYHSVETISALNKIDLPEFLSTNHGLSILECKTNPDASMELRKKLWDFQP